MQKALPHIVTDKEVSFRINPKGVLSNRFFFKAVRQYPENPTNDLSIINKNIEIEIMSDGVRLLTGLKEEHLGIKAFLPEQYKDDKRLVTFEEFTINTCSPEKDSHGVNTYFMESLFNFKQGGIFDITIRFMRLIPEDTIYSLYYRTNYVNPRHFLSEKKFLKISPLLTDKLLIPESTKLEYVKIFLKDVKDKIVSHSSCNILEIGSNNVTYTYDIYEVFVHYKETGGKKNWVQWLLNPSVKFSTNHKQGWIKTFEGNKAYTNDTNYPIIHFMRSDYI